MSEKTVTVTIEERLQKRLAELVKQRADFLAQANQQLANMTGAIEALEALLKEPETPLEPVL